jgi:putative ABC transport system permease protein
MRIALMALRNVFRQKRRTLITLSALVIGLMGLVVFQGFIGQLMRGLRDSSIRSGIGSLQIAGGEGYFENGEFDPYAYEMRDAERRMAMLEKDADVEAVFPSTGFTSIAGLGDKSTTLLVKGYPAERMYFSPPGSPALGGVTVGDLGGRFSLGALTAGASIRAGDRDKIVLGETAARILKVGVGDVVTLMAVLPNGGLNGRDFEIAAIYRSAGRDKLFAFTDYASAADFTGLRGAPVLHVFVKDISKVSALSERLPGGAAHRTWRDLAVFYVQANTMFSGFLDVIRTIILLITLFILGNTMNRIVFERTREWGTLRALGTKRRDIMFLVVLEGCFLGAAGALLGIALGYGAAAAINLAGGLPYHGTTSGQTVLVRIVPDAPSLLFDLIPVVITAGMAAYFPGRRAVAMTPSECLRQI